MYLSRDGGLYGATKKVYPRQEEVNDVVAEDSEYGMFRAAAIEMGLEPDEAEREIEDLFGGTPDEYDLMGVCGNPDTGATAWDESRRFCLEWNKRYPAYMALTKSENRGEYPSIQLKKFNQACRDSETFPSGPEEAACDLARELGIDY